MKLRIHCGVLVLLTGIAVLAGCGQQAQPGGNTDKKDKKDPSKDGEPKGPLVDAGMRAN